jgi:DNA-binding transcriptional LysR family regulator
VGSAGGRKLGLPPAAASARLLKLEASFSTHLFERTTRQLRLTDEGRLYLQHCRQALQALDDARAALSAENKEIRGKVRISATSDFGRHELNPWLDAFTALHPQVVPALLSDSLSHLIAFKAMPALHSESTALGIQSDPSRTGPTPARLQTPQSRNR